MTVTFYCGACNYSYRCDDENMPDECPRCGYDGEDESTSEPDVDAPDDDERIDEAAEWGGMDNGY